MFILSTWGKWRGFTQSLSTSSPPLHLATLRRRSYARSGEVDLSTSSPLRVRTVEAYFVTLWRREMDTEEPA